MPSAAISKLLSMRTGQGYAEFAVSSFGTDAAIGDPEHAARHVGRIPAGQPRHHHLRRHLRVVAQHHRRAVAGAASRPVIAPKKSHADLSHVCQAGMVRLSPATQAALGHHHHEFHQGR
jgi:hypothetical protein